MEIFGLPLKTFLTVVLVPVGIIIVLFIWGMLYKPSNGVCSINPRNKTPCNE